MSKEWLTGFGEVGGAEMEVFRPATTEQLSQLLSERETTLRGCGKSYGDVAIDPACDSVNISNFNEIKLNGEIAECGAGVTIRELCQAALERGYWPAVVPGTAQVSLGGAFAANIHGKSSFRVGTFAEHVTQIELITPTGPKTFTDQDPEFWAVAGSMGLLGAITKLYVRLKKVGGPWLKVAAHSCRNWDEHFETFDNESDYAVSWVDLYGNARGISHTAVYSEWDRPLNPKPMPPALQFIARQTLHLSKSRVGAQLINTVRYVSGKREAANHHQDLFSFNFLLDRIPNWQRCFRPHGFYQIQPFVPHDAAKSAFEKMRQIQIKHGLVSHLAVLKRHKASPMLLDYGCKGFSLAMDFVNVPKLGKLAREIIAVTLDHGGKFYLAKDQLLTQHDFYRLHEREKIEKFLRLKAEWDPENRLSSSRSRAIGLDSSILGNEP